MAKDVAKVKVVKDGQVKTAQVVLITDRKAIADLRAGRVVAIVPQPQKG